MKKKAKKKSTAKRKGTPRPTCIGNKFAVGNNGGRPEIWTVERLDELVIELKKWMQKADALYLKTFCYEQDFLAVQAEEFCKKSEKFSLAWKKAKQWQEQKLVSLGLNKKISEGMTKFVLINCHDMKEKTELSGDASNPLSFIMERIGQNAKDPLEYYEEE